MVGAVPPWLRPKRATLAQVRSHAEQEKNPAIVAGFCGVVERGGDFGFRRVVGV